MGAPFSGGEVQGPAIQDMQAGAPSIMSETTLHDPDASRCTWQRTAFGEAQPGCCRCKPLSRTNWRGRLG